MLQRAKIDGTSVTVLLRDLDFGLAESAHLVTTNALIACCFCIFCAVNGVMRAIRYAVALLDSSCRDLLTIFNGRRKFPSLLSRKRKRKSLIGKCRVYFDMQAQPHHVWLCYTSIVAV